MKRFALFSFGMLCLMLAIAVGYHLGSQTAQAQGGEIGFYRVGVTENWVHHFVMLPGGDVYRRKHDAGQTNFTGAPLEYMGNYWDGPPVPVESSTWGGIKGQLGTDKK